MRLLSKNKSMLLEDIEQKEFVIVHCSLKLFNDNFKKDRNTEIVNYHDIMSKLENNDIYKNVPDRNIIEYYIIRKINNIINTKKTKRIFYFLENLEIDIIQAIKRIITTDHDICYKLLLIEDDDIDDIKQEFDTIQIFNLDDKTQINK